MFPNTPGAHCVRKMQGKTGKLVDFFMLHLIPGKDKQLHWSRDWRRRTKVMQTECLNSARSAHVKVKANSLY